MKIQYPNQTHCSYQHRFRSTTCSRPDVRVLYHWLSLLLLVGVLVLFPERPAWGMGLDLSWTQSGISTSGAGCFISASISEFSGISLLFGLCLLTMIYGFKLLIRSARTKHDME